ncbi:major facilitator superfamily domain-containing protein [Coniella lustricola]|uniref:Major facilitator superfamily domain-containing protein n=1 Tax=Coniella lustricola TaxID=2025994 RepID=A0A2T2ZTI2_9PEZI|nr:major facilitator superfamily domain-containing protein [Coniella lustricola]
MTPMPEKRFRWLPIIFILLMLFVDGIGYFVSQAPTTQLFEDIACRRYYQSSTITESLLCKAPGVQREVATIFGWQAFFDGIPSLILALWYGALADRYGRRGVLFLSMLGQALGMAWVLLICWMDLPLKLTWFSSAFLVIGGGSTVTMAACMMVVTDVTQEYNRSKVFFACQATFLISEVIGPALGSIAMDSLGVWPPVLVGLVCTCVTVALAGTIPETRSRESTKYTDSNTADSLDDVLSDPGSLKQSVFEMLSNTKHTLQIMCQNRSILILVASFLIVDFSRQSLTILLQYISKRYDISLAKASYLLSYRGLATLIVYAAILPTLDTLVEKRLGLSAQMKDLQLARLSIILSSLGFGILFAAPSLKVIIIALGFLTLGTGFGSFVRSLLSSVVEPDVIGTMYTTLSIMDSLGSIAAGPIVSGLFNISMDLEGVWVGIPFLSSFLLSCVIAVLVLAVRPATLAAQQSEGTLDADDARSALLPREV